MNHFATPTCVSLVLQVLRLSEEQLSGGVLDDSSVSVIARGCTQLQELELVQVSSCHCPLYRYDQR